MEYLSKEKSPLKTQGRQKLTRYHLVSQLTLPQDADNGAYPGQANAFTCPAPRPCSAAIPYPFSPTMGSLKVLPAYSPLHSISKFTGILYPLWGRFVNCDFYFSEYAQKNAFHATPADQLVFIVLLGAFRFSCFGKKSSKRSRHKGRCMPRSRAPKTPL